MATSDQKRRAIVHVGLEKTGTTSIQQTLNNNRHRLRKVGFLFPRSPGKTNHTRLVAACLDVGVADNLKAFLLSRRGESEAELIFNFKADFDEELKTAGEWSTLIISSELISSRLHTTSEVKRLVGLLDPHVDDICFLIYLRRQDQLALSRFSSALRAGHTDFGSVLGDLSANAFLQLPAERDSNDIVEFFNYDHIISRFENLGDNVSVKVELYDSPKGLCDPLRTFYGHLGPSAAGLLPPQEKTVRLNRAMSAEAQYIISLLNTSHPVQLLSGERNMTYRSVLKQVEMEVTGQDRTLQRSDAEAFFELFHDSNERVRERYFPTQATLFDNDFSSYPRKVEYESMKQEVAPILQKYIELTSSNLSKSGRLKQFFRYNLIKNRLRM
jgi:hypothetical protein